MHGELDILLNILKAQRDCQAALVELSERKIKAITEGDTDALGEIVEREKEVLADIKAVERRQESSVARLAALLGIPASSVRMSLIIEQAQGSQRRDLERLRTELTELVDRQIKYNEMNMKLLQMNMDYVQFLINTSANQPAAPTYGSAGGLQKPEPVQKRLLDRKV